ncbi:MAG: 1-deoxy-D-xylulose-5-phosphate synthase [Clostridia bacterium]
MLEYRILDKVNSPRDLKKLSKEQTDELCTEIADFLVQNVSKTGGHLSPNLGIIELTIALHKVFDTEKDRFIFDVGHQSYVHKILTGRREKFDTLRQKDGLSGFTKPSESVHDAFVSGHASVSISAALGMAHARTLKHENHSVVAIIGDGALTGGLAYEALNNAGLSKEPLIVILNDNRMSITQNVGAIDKHLAKLRTSDKYLGTKQIVRKFLGKSIHGERLTNIINRVKHRFKMALLETSFFEQMGFVYLGPIDGHDVKSLCDVLTHARELAKPVFIHVITKKGRGYKYSEEQPERYHGIGKFDTTTGNVINKKADNFSQNFGDTIVNLASNNQGICAITAAMSSGTGLSNFAEKYPDRFFDVGIAEAHAVTMSAGLAISGMTPVCAIYSTFLQRAYDQLIHDVALENLHVVFAIDRAGIVGDDGETHNGVFDIPMALSIPNYTVFAPSNYAEQTSMLDIAINQLNSPVIVRYPRGSQGDFLENTADLDYKVYNEKGKICIITYGVLINNIFGLIESHDLCVVKINKLTLDLQDFIENISFDKIIILEDCVNTGSLGQKISAEIVRKNKQICFLKLLNTGDKFTKQATVEQVHNLCDLSREGVIKTIEEALFSE